MRSCFSFAPPHCRHTCGRVVPQRPHTSISPGNDTTPAQRSHVATVAHFAQASSFARPVRFKTHTTRPVPRASSTARSDQRPLRGSSPLRSTISVRGQPRRSVARSVSTSVAPGEMLERRRRRDQARRAPPPARLVRRRRPRRSTSARVPPHRPRRGRRSRRPTPGPDTAPRRPPARPTTMFVTPAPRRRVCHRSTRESDGTSSSVGPVRRRDDGVPRIDGRRQPQHDF